MFRRIPVFICTLVILFGVSVFMPTAHANCVRSPNNPALDNVVTCDGGDPDGVNVGGGNDTVNITNGVVYGPILSSGGNLTILMDTLSWLDTYYPGSPAIVMNGDGSITLVGSLTSSGNGITIEGDGTVDTSEDGYLSARYGTGIYVSGEGEVTNRSDISADANGIVIVGAGKIFNSGWMYSIGQAIYLQSGGEFVNEGDVSSSDFAVHIVGDGIIDNRGSIRGGFDGIFVNGNAELTNSGEINGWFNGVSIIGNARVVNSGTIATFAYTTLWIQGNADILNTGTIGGGSNGGSSIVITQDGVVVNQGTIDAMNGNAIQIEGTGTVVNEDTITALNGRGIDIYHEGEVYNSGTIRGDYSGVSIGSGLVVNDGLIDGGRGTGAFIGGNGMLINNGTITTSNGEAVFIYGDGHVINLGTLSGLSGGIAILGNGVVETQGSIDGGLYGNGIFIQGTGQVSAQGDIKAGDFGSGIWVLGNAQIHVEGDVTGGQYGHGIVVWGTGTIETSGTVEAGVVGIDLQGDGTIRTSGSVEAGEVGINGGEGNQTVIVSGSVDAPVAVRLNGGSDTVYLQSSADVQGSVEMGEGDDTVLIGDHAVVTNTVFGGEGGETNGDLILIGDGHVCSENAQAAADAQANAQALGALNPDNGTVTYLGQTYTWAEFERIASGKNVSPCVGQINDGRINSFDLGAPNALYCTVGGGISVWQIDLTGKGTFSFAVTSAQIAAAFGQAVSSGVNQQIAVDSLGNALYALSDGHTITFVGHDLREPGKQYMTTQERTLCA
jgi:hypothetical protein